MARGNETESAKLPSPLSPSLLSVICTGETGKKGQDATELHKQPAAVFVIWEASAWVSELKVGDEIADSHHPSTRKDPEDGRKSSFASGR